MCLIACVCGSSGALADLWAIAAAFDSSHDGQIEVRNDRIVVTLKHTAREAVSQHQHSTVARWLCAWQTTQTDGTDHRFEFVTGNLSEQFDGTIRPIVSAALADFWISEAVRPALCRATKLDDDGAPDPLTLISVRSTVLLV